ncbi:hypothetical protein GQ55_6G051700 [Panicum hallii var. hallii]|uniref:Uncharacterized protein n=1 Tax=Panicum hallii var. hallii TaxID=1504633 RepID=A0A2T7D412_9POAL|nr:hypothetical protein GQ55_6G051700 [Panicum hallii var. hallii]
MEKRKKRKWERKKKGRKRKMERRERTTRAGGIRARDARTLREENSEGRGKRVGANRGGGRGRSATRAVFARGEREKKGSRVGANHGRRSRVSDKPPSGAGRDSDPVRVGVLTSNSFYTNYSSA